jgi:cytochrome P450
VQRDERFFENAQEFNPDRWTDDFVKRMPRYSYFPFGGGPRLCIGNSFAMMESVLLLAAIAQRFKLGLSPEHPVALLPALSLRPRDGIKMTLAARRVNSDQPAHHHEKEASTPGPVS